MNLDKKVESGNKYFVLISKITRPILIIFFVLFLDYISPNSLLKSRIGSLTLFMIFFDLISGVIIYFLFLWITRSSSDKNYKILVRYAVFILFCIVLFLIHVVIKNFFGFDYTIKPPIPFN